jgi:hypothetical protein
MNYSLVRSRRYLLTILLVAVPGASCRTNGEHTPAAKPPHEVIPTVKCTARFNNTQIIDLDFTFTDGMPATGEAPSSITVFGNSGWGSDGPWCWDSECSTYSGSATDFNPTIYTNAADHKIHDRFVGTSDYWVGVRVYGRKAGIPALLFSRCGVLHYDAAKPVSLELTDN